MTRLPDLALQYVATNGACHLFARAALLLPTTTGARLAEIDEGERDHAFLLLADGTALDAEGVRSIEALRRDFALPARVPVSFNDASARTPDEIERTLAAHLAGLGWDEALPAHDPDLCATGRWAEARDRFEALGGWNGGPMDLIRRLEGRAASDESDMDMAA